MVRPLERDTEPKNRGHSPLGTAQSSPARGAESGPGASPREGHGRTSSPGAHRLGAVGVDVVPECSIAGRKRTSAKAAQPTASKSQMNQIAGKELRNTMGSRDRNRAVFGAGSGVSPML